jgi:hypothetical protein
LEWPHGNSSKGHQHAHTTKGQNGDISAVAIKQLYASHYFHTALDLSVCVSDTAKPGGFYLLTIKGSEQEGLTGPKRFNPAKGGRGQSPLVA